MSDHPLVTVIVTTKNEAHNIRRCLQSVRHQTHLAIEIIVVDNFSVDDTRKIAAPIADVIECFGPERSAQRNRGIALAQGKYICIIDADMELTPTVIEECVGAITGGSRAIVIPEQATGTGIWARCKAFEKALSAGSPEIEATRFFESTILRQVGGYDEDLYAWEDWDLAQRVDRLTQRARIKSAIIHHEGELSLWRTFSKKRYYGRLFPAYRSKHPSAAKQQVSLGRLTRILSYIRICPKLVVATLVLKIVEAFGLLLAVTIDRIIYRPTK